MQQVVRICGMIEIRRGVPLDETEPLARRRFSMVAHAGRQGIGGGVVDRIDFFQAKGKAQQ
ncbi:hypothetical protein N825_22310 [Skermanella stibiiresistens SB22]|uniref:Uncharacterized protein n=1 Tax=Skermanella stibiiresistens SB22 TaxID=1385369 RepID=W9GWM6_9PROT|nr:hypothetical protein N825_22310 [Skermanella stibiiresistens SB22]